jgi:multicomponent Na+:H+ antiporter subunit E
MILRGSRAAAGTLSRVRAGDAAVRSLILIVLWWILAGGSWSAPLLAAAVIGAALVASFRLTPAISWHLSIRAIGRFIPYFLKQSLRGGLDVAHRALNPRLPIAPETIDFEVALPSNAARIFFCCVASLLPGTLGVTLPADGRMRIHVLDRTSFDAGTLLKLERLVQELFSARMQSGTGG